MSTDQEPRTERRGNYVRFAAIPGHQTDANARSLASSAACCAWFEGVIDDFLRHAADGEGTGADREEVHGQTFEAACRFHRVFGFPDNIEAGLRVGQLGSCSVRFEIGLFRAGEDKPVATGYVVRVFVAQASGKPASLPAGLRARLAELVKSA